MFEILNYKYLIEFLYRVKKISFEKCNFFRIVKLFVFVFLSLKDN